MHKLRQKASGRRVRYQSEGGYDLDLSYITDRIIAMPIPSEQKLTFKNSIADVVRFLDQLHANHYRLYNLCLEGKYSYEKFQGRVSEYQFPENGAPSLSLVVNFVNDAADWLDHHPRNVCVVHCNNGKGRTGAMVACLLLKIGACSTPSEALQLFATRRTTDGKAVVKNPSQLRYVGFYDHFRKGLLQFESPDSAIKEVDVLKIDGRGIGDARIEQNIPRVITGIRLSTAPQFRRRGGCVPWFSIEQKGKRIFFSPPMKGVKHSESVYFSSLRIIVAGDIRLDFYHKSFKTKMFSCSLHTAAFKVSVISLPKRELDIACKDKNNKHFPPNFKLEIFLAAASDLDDVENSERISVSLPESVVGNTDSVEEKEKTQEKIQPTPNTCSSTYFSSASSYSSTSSAHTSVSNMSLSSTLTRIRASTQLVSVSVIGARCARCREVLGEEDFYLEVSGVSIHWDCLQCNECGRVFGEQEAGDSVVLMREKGGIGCAHCGDFRSFFPSCSRCGDPVTAESDCCVSVPAATTYWHVACFSCAQCAAPLTFSDEDALWRIEQTTGMPMCFFHPHNEPPSASSSFLATSVASQSPSSSPPPPSPSSGFLPKIPSTSLHRQNSIIHNEERPQSQIQERSRPSPRQSQLEPTYVDTTQQDHLQSHQQGEEEPRQSIQQSPHQQPSYQQTSRHVPQIQLPSQRTKQLVVTPTLTPTPTQFPPIAHPPVRKALGSCSGCNGDVQEGDDVLVVAETVWHPSCLQCAHCHAPLSPSHRVTAVNGKLYCREDFEKLFGVSCGRCHKIIEPGSSYFNTGSIQFHMDCFSCVVCHKRLSDGVFFMRGEAALCEMHKSHIPTQLINSDRLSTDRLVHESRASANISTRKDSGEALCHSAAALIKTAKDVMMASGEFDKKVFVTLAKQLATVSRQAANDVENVALASEASQAHEDLIQFCAQHFAYPPPSTLHFTCSSLNTSITFLEEMHGKKIS